MTNTTPTHTTTADETRSAPSKTGRTSRPPRVARKAAKTTRAGKTTKAAARATADEPTAPAKAPTKLDKVIGLLARPEGASIDELCAATGWQAHSVRGAMAGALRKKGHVISSEKHDDVRRYRIGAGT